MTFYVAFKFITFVSPVQMEMCRLDTAAHLKPAHCYCISIVPPLSREPVFITLHISISGLAVKVNAEYYVFGAFGHCLILSQCLLGTDWIPVLFTRIFVFPIAGEVLWIPEWGKKWMSHYWLNTASTNVILLPPVVQLISVRAVFRRRFVVVGSFANH